MGISSSSLLLAICLVGSFHIVLSARDGELYRDGALENLGLCY